MDNIKALFTALYDFIVKLLTALGEWPIDF